MNQDVFKSGRWVGFYVYEHDRRRHRMDMELTFQNGSISGEGNDSLGAFVIKGGYECKTGECHWTKSYVGQHDVFYRGYRESKGIWGTWEIDQARGGFRIWPRRSGNDVDEAEFNEATAPVEAVGELIPA